jgi:four helix bundle protein
MSYKDLEIWKIAQKLVNDVHLMTITQLPKFEMYEEGSQIRRSIKSVKSTIVEGYGRRRYKQEFIKFLIYSLSSNDETIDHLDTLFITGSLKDNYIFIDLNTRLITSVKKIYSFLQTVETSHRSVK